MDIIVNKFELCTGHRMPKSAKQKILHYALEYNPAYAKLHRELKIKVGINSVIKRLDIWYESWPMTCCFSQTMIKEYISVLKKCRCCERHMEENRRPVVPVLIRQNACVNYRQGRSGYVCNCACAFYVKELILC